MFIDPRQNFIKLRNSAARAALRAGFFLCTFKFKPKTMDNRVVPEDKKNHNLVFYKFF